MAKRVETYIKYVIYIVDGKEVTKEEALKHVKEMNNEKATV